mmetsp:Transcript_20361/g.36232  ORF Transcript_20361/g.36232 Transcript_20361/m.36232 type:complete len:294 (+) Transcript_20361:358-1239(+)
MGGSSSSRRLLSYSGVWRKGKLFDEKQRLLIESGREDKGEVRLVVDLFNRKFQLKLKYRRTEWWSMEEKPQGQIDITRGRICVSGRLSILADRKRDKVDVFSNNETESGISVRCYIENLELHIVYPNASWKRKLGYTLRNLGLSKRKKRETKERKHTQEDRKFFRALDSTSVHLLMSQLLGIHTGGITIKELSKTIASYLSNVDWLHLGILTPNVLNNNFTFKVDLKKDARKNGPQTIVPIPFSGEALLEAIEDAAHYEDDKLRKEAAHQYGKNSNEKMMEPPTVFALRVLTR